MYIYTEGIGRCHIQKYTAVILAHFCSLTPMYKRLVAMAALQARHDHHHRRTVGGITIIVISTLLALSLELSLPPASPAAAPVVVVLSSWNVSRWWWQATRKSGMSDPIVCVLGRPYLRPRRRGRTNNNQITVNTPIVEWGC